MQRSSLDLSMLSNVTWWSWLATIVLLALRFAGYPGAALAAIVLCLGLAIMDLILRRGDIAAMGVQIRLAYAVLLVVGLMPGMGWMHVVQLVGTSARVLTGYCLLERELLMMPWNHVGMMSPGEMWKMLVASPGAGGILRFGSAGQKSPCQMMLQGDTAA